MIPRILVADDHPVVADGISRCFTPLPATVSIVTSPEGVFSALRETAFELLVLDISFRGSGTTGFHILRDCRNKLPNMPILIVSMFDDPVLQEAARREGASGFISKTETGSRLKAAAGALLGGQTWFVHHADPILSVTPRQEEIISRLASGRSEKEVASDLGITLRTVEFHIERAKKSLGAHSIGELVSIVHRRGYFLLPGGIKNPPG